jgi:hypothetical protein
MFRAFFEETKVPPQDKREFLTLSDVLAEYKDRIISLARGTYQGFDYEGSKEPGSRNYDPDFMSKVNNCLVHEKLGGSPAHGFIRLELILDNGWVLNYADIDSTKTMFSVTKPIARPRQQP